MKYGRSRKQAAAEKPVEHWGFREDGSSFKSSEPVENVWTRAVWHMCREIRLRSLRPDEVVMEISKLPESVRTAFDVPLAGDFHSVLGQWSTLSTFREWKLAWVGSPVLSTIKYRAAGCPMSSDQEHDWLERCRLAERIHGEPPLDTKPFDLSEFMRTLTGGKKPLFTDDMLAEKDRQLAAFKAAHPEVA